MIAFDEAKMRYPMDLRKPVFNRIAAFVTPYALRRIDDQYRLLTDQATAVNRCTGSFTTTTGLPYSHKVQERLFGPEGCLILEDVHPHWRFERSSLPDPINDPALDPLLQVEKPAVVQPRGRPAGAENRRQALDNSTYRNPSQFEIVEGEIAEQHGNELPANIERVLARAEATSAGRGRGRGRERQ